MNDMFCEGDTRQHLLDDIRIGAFKMVKCQCCQEQEAVYAWQPFGPGEDANTFMLLGHHYRGFPVIKTCHNCTTAFMSDDAPVSFSYKGSRYVGQNHEVREVKAQ
jgi:hypothetical protein